MKTLRILFFIFLASFFTINVSKAQTIKNEVSGTWERFMWECDGDYLYGTFSGIEITHFNKNGDADWIKSSINAEVVSASTGEVFKVSQHVKHNLVNPGETNYFTFHQNYVGNMGTIYQIAVTFEIDPSGTWTAVKEKAHCM